MTRALAILALLALTGCGTFITRTGLEYGDGPIPAHPNLVYSGVVMDAETIGQGGVWMLLDLPFSAVADTLCLPWDIPQTNQQKGSQ